MIFISYRRADSESLVGRIYSELKKHFPTQEVFLDHDSIPLGKPFQDVIHKRLATSKFALVLIGPQWCSIRDERTGQRRLDDPNDFVRLEVETALTTPGLTVIPVIVGNAKFPSDSELPATLKAIASRQAIYIRPEPDEGSDIRKLIAAMKRLLPESSSPPHVFASYSLKDRDRVVPFIGKLLEKGVNVYYDGNLTPGSNWQQELGAALESSSGMIVFVSPRSMQSEWVKREIAASVSRQGHKLVIPVILEHTSELPTELSTRQWVDISGDRSESELTTAAQRIADAFAGLQSPNPDEISRVDLRAQNALQTFADELRQVDDSKQSDSPPDSVFIVHGHDEEFLAQVESFLQSLGIRTLVLKRLGSGEQSLLGKFFDHSSDAHFAVALVSADDYGAGLFQYDLPEVRDRSLQFRSRQNVILELGFFYGRLGWERVFVLSKRPPRRFPNFERPSDLNGVVFDEVDESGRWKLLLRERLRQAGFVLFERNDK